MELTKWINVVTDAITSPENNRFWWDMYGDFPDDSKGELAKKFWTRENLEGSEMMTAHPSDAFSYGAEYGALIILHELEKIIVSTKPLNISGEK